MIEAIIKRFQDAGFTVRVMHSNILGNGVLSIWQRIREEEIRMDWCIPQHDLNLPADHLFYMTDQRIFALNQAIAEKQRRLA